MRDHRSAADAVVERLSASSGADEAPVWEAMDSLGAGHRADAAARLRAWTAAGGADRTVPLGQLVGATLAYAEGDLATLAHDLLARYGPGWSEHCPVRPARFLTELAAVAPAVLVELLRAEPGIDLDPPARDAVVHAVVDEARRSPHCGVALDIVRVASAVLAGDS